jgi:hypothetical protein
MWILLLWWCIRVAICFISQAGIQARSIPPYIMANVLSLAGHHQTIRRALLPGTDIVVDIFWSVLALGTVPSLLLCIRALIGHWNARLMILTDFFLPLLWCGYIYHRTTSYCSLAWRIVAVTLCYIWILNYFCNYYYNNIIICIGITMQLLFQ